MWLQIGCEMQWPIKAYHRIHEGQLHEQWVHKLRLLELSILKSSNSKSSSIGNRKITLSSINASGQRQTLVNSLSQAISRLFILNIIPIKETPPTHPLYQPSWTDKLGWLYSQGCSPVHVLYSLSPRPTHPCIPSVRPALRCSHRVSKNFPILLFLSFLTNTRYVSVDLKLRIQTNSKHIRSNYPWKCFKKQLKSAMHVQRCPNPNPE